MKPAPYVCAVCGGPMARLSSGGKERDENGKWRASTRQMFRCERAFREYVLERARVLREVDGRFDAHLEVETLLWPIPKVDAARSLA